MPFSPSLNIQRSPQPSPQVFVLGAGRIGISQSRGWKHECKNKADGHAYQFGSESVGKEYVRCSRTNCVTPQAMATIVNDVTVKLTAHKKLCGYKNHNLNMSNL